MSSTNTKIIEDLRHILVKLRALDFSSPLAALRTIQSTVSRVYEVVTEPPAPDPENARTSAATWKRMGESMDVYEGNVQTARNGIGEASWGSDPGDEAGTDGGEAARNSFDRFSKRSGTVAPAGRSIATSLTTFAEDMEKARTRHDEAFNDASDKLSIKKMPLDPRKLPGYVKEVAEAVIHGVEELKGSYEDASEAATTAAGKIRTALEGITLPDHVSGALGAVTSVNGWSGAAGTGKDEGSTDTGPLREGVLERADERLAGMSESDRKTVQDLLDSAKTDQQRAWIMSAVASGADMDTLRNFAGKVNGMSPDELARLDPTKYMAESAWRDAKGHGVFSQPDPTTCGSASLVTAKMVNDPVYALKVMTGYDATTGLDDGAGSGGDVVHKRFGDEATVMHDRTNMVWPERLGTSPWGAAEQMSDGSGVSGTEYGVHLADPANSGGEFERIAATVQSGQVVPLYVGDGLVPRHVVLAVGSQGDSLQIYEPSTGKTYSVPRSELANDRAKEGFGRWSEYWGAVLPQ